MSLMVLWWCSRRAAIARIASRFLWLRAVSLRPKEGSIQSLAGDEPRARLGAAPSSPIADPCLSPSCAPAPTRDVIDEREYHHLHPSGALREGGFLGCAL